MAASRSLADAATWGGSEKAAAAFRKWKSADVKSVLDVSNCNLTSLPVELGQLHGLVVFYCSYNQLTSLPAELGQLRYLIRLLCDHNQLAALPAELGKLRFVVDFNCSYNELTSLPVELVQLPTNCSFNSAHNAIPEGEPSTIAELRATPNARAYVPAPHA